MNKFTTKALLTIAFIYISVNYNISAQQSNSKPMNEHYETATLGGGCFWCTEAIYKQVKGIVSVTSGYSGGTTENPTYREVCTGTTRYAEVIQIVFDNQAIKYHDILEIFWHIHDPTTLNQQGADFGTQYRSVIFYHSEEQKAIAEDMKAKYNNTNEFGKNVVTEISAFHKFYKAEDYHQEYYENNNSQSYCKIVITPKIKKFQEQFGKYKK